MDIPVDATSGYTHADFAAQSRANEEQCIALRARCVREATEKHIASLREQRQRESGPPPPRAPAWHAQMIPFLILGLLATGARASIGEQSACDNPLAVDTLILAPFDGDALSYYYAICLQNPACASAFFLLDTHGTPAPSGRRGFEVLFPQALEVPGLSCAFADRNNPFSQVLEPTLCDGDRDLRVDQAIELAEMTWVPCMTVGMQARELCDVNEVWLYNSETGEGRCTCADTRNCSNSSNNDTVLGAIAILFLILGAASLVYRLWQLETVFVSAKGE